MNSVNAERYNVFTALTVGTVNVSPFTGFTAFLNPTLAFCSFEGSAIRVRLDGVSAHSATGHLISAGSFTTFKGSDVLKGLNLICPTTTGVVVVSLGN